MDPLTVELDPLGIWRMSYFFGLAACTIGFLYFKVKLPLIAKLLWGYVLLYALVRSEFPLLFFLQYNGAFQLTAAQVFIEVLLVPVGAIVFGAKAWKLVPYVMVYEIAAIWLKLPTLLMAISFDNALLALYLPFANPYLAAASVATILFHHGSTAITMLGLYLLIAARRHPKLLLLLPALALSVYLNRYIGGPHELTSAFLSGTGRFEKWVLYMTAIRDSALGKWAMGIGPGTFMNFELAFSKPGNPIFLQLHSDFLQIAWELGLIGWGLAIGTFLLALKRAWHNPQLLCAVLGCFGFMLTYHPLRHFIPAFLVCLIFNKLLKGKIE